MSDSGVGPSVCILTPTGRGAVAVVRVWGPGALEAADAAFRPAYGKNLAATPPRRPRFGRLGAGLGTRSSRWCSTASRAGSRSSATAGRRPSRWSSTP